MNTIATWFDAMGMGDMMGGSTAEPSGLLELY